MFHTRYDFARQWCENKDVLELGCGTGLGLEYLAKHAHYAVGSDYCTELLRDASQRTGGAIPLVCLDAHALPFPENSFDVIVLFEAIYYLADPGTVLCECRRVLKPDGVLLVCLVNRNWPGFNRSPFSKRYFSANELYQLFVKHDFCAQVYGGSLSKPSTFVEKVLDRVRRAAVRAQLIPASFKAKAKLKKLFYGRLESIGAIEEGKLQIAPLSPIPPGEDTLEHRVLYALGRPLPASVAQGRTDSVTTLQAGTP